MARFTEMQRAALASAMQDEVFRVASEILRAEGFAGLTMERIAQEAGVARGTIYNYFTDAEAVLNFVEGRVVEPVFLAVEEIADSGIAAAAKLASIASVMFDRINEDRALALAVISKRELSGPRAAHKLKTHRRFLDIVQRIVGEGVASGEFRPVAAPVLAKIFLGALSGLIEVMFLAGEVQSSEEIVPHLMDALLHGIKRTPDSHD